MMRNAELESSLYAYFAESTRPSWREGKLYLETPLIDADGEPIAICVEETDSGIVIHDGGRTAGALFTSEQEAEGSPGYRLVQAVIDAWRLKMNFDAGVVERRVEGKVEGREIWALAQAVAALSLTIPHIRIQRGRTTLGSRLRGRIRSIMKERNVLDLVDQRRQISGRRFDKWIVDFYYRPTAMITDYEVAVTALDLDVAEPLEKAEHAITLAMDVREGGSKASVRVVYDTHGRNSASEQAKSLLDGYQHVGYDAFDYRLPEDHARFIERIEQELFPEEWRALRH